MLEAEIELVGGWLDDTGQGQAWSCRENLVWVRGIWNAVDPRDGRRLGGAGMRRGQDAGTMAGRQTDDERTSG